jgi:hypothetical protein
MSDLAAYAAAPTSVVPDDLAEGNLFVELQVPSWPPSTSQTLMRHREDRRALTIRAKPSGRLRVELARSGYAPVIVRTVHLRLRAPGLLRLNVVWRGDVVVVAAGGQIIGRSSEFSPDGMVAPEMVEETEAPPDHVGNERARLARRHANTALLQGIESAPAAMTGWLEALGDAVRVVDDLVELVRQGRRHHLVGLADAVTRLVAGDMPLLQRCAALFDAPLPLYAPISLKPQTATLDLVVSAFDVASARDQHHQMAVDLDVWLRHEHPWIGGQHVPVAVLLLAIDSALMQARPDRGDSGIDREIRSAFTQGQSVAALCNFAAVVSTLATSIVALARAEEASPGGSK